MFKFAPAVAGFCLLLTATAAATAEPPGIRVAQAEMVNFDIAAQPLPQALNALARQAGIQIVYTTEAPFGVQSRGVTGRLSVEAALSRILAGSGLLYRFTDATTVTLEPAAASGSLALPAITVTAEKTARALQDTAASVSVFTDRDIEEGPGVATLSDALVRMPNVVETGTGNFAPTVRGIDTTGPANGVFAFLGGVRPRVTIQQDGRPLNFNELVYGRSGVWDVDQIEVLRGPQTTLQGRNSIAGAIVVNTKDPTFEWEGGGRIVGGSDDTRQGSVAISGPLLEDQLAFRISGDRRDHKSWVELNGPVLPPDAREEKYENVRGKLLFLPARLPDLSAKLTLNHTKSRRPQSEYVSRPLGNRTLNATAALTFPVFENEANSAILELGYDLTPDLQVRNTATYSDIDISRLTSPGAGIADILVDEYTNEFVAEYRSGRWHAIAGAYYLHSQSDEVIDIGPGAFDDQTETVAVFGEATVTVFEDIDLTLGGRYEREHRERFGSASVFVLNLDETFDAFLPKAGIAWRATDDVTVGATVQRGFNAGGAGIAFIPPFPSFTYDAEYVWNYEAFVRTSWLGNRLTVNGNVFYADYQDQQRLAYLLPDNPSSGVIRNAEETSAYGAEVEATWLVLPELEVFGSLGLLQTEIKSFPASVQNLEGNDFARAPDVTATFGAIYRHHSGFRAGFDGRYVGSYFSNDDNLRTEEVRDHVLLNAQLGWQIETLRVFAYVTNILDSDDELLLFEGSGQLVDPREVGVGLQVSF
jgi:outer membrane receptor protein involved in Fe transport